MHFKHILITSGVVVAAGATGLGIMAPAAFATPTASPAAKTSISVQIDKAHHDAVVTTKKGTFTVNWEAFAKGKRDLVTVRNSDKKLVAARVVSEQRLTKVLTSAQQHPGAIRHLWLQHHEKVAKKAAAAKK